MQSPSFASCVLLTVSWLGGAMALAIPESSTAHPAPKRIDSSYYIAVDGDDVNGDGSAGAPWHSLQAAIDRVPSGSTVMASGGVYTGPIALTTAANGKVITIVGTGAEQTTFTDPSNLLTWSSASGCASATISFRDCGLISTGGTVLTLIHQGDLPCTLDLQRCLIQAGHHGCTSVGVNPATSVTLTNCELSVDWNLVSVPTGQVLGCVALNGCTFNDRFAVSGDVFNIQGTLYRLSIMASQFDAVGTTTAHGFIRATTGRVDTLTIGGQTNVTIAAGGPCIQLANAYGPVEIVDSTFVDADPMGIRRYNGTTHWIDLSATEGNITFNKNVVNVFAASTNANGGSNAVNVRAKGATVGVVVCDNTVNSSASGIGIGAPTVDCGTVVCCRNTVVVDYQGNTAGTARGISIGTSTELDEAAFGVASILDNSVTYAGSVGGQGMILGRQIAARGSEIARNRVVNVSSWTAAVVPYGYYALFRNTHFHHNCAYARSALTLIGVQDSVIQYNSMYSPRQDGTGKGACSLVTHGGFEHERNTFRYNIICCAMCRADGSVLYMDAGSTPADLTHDYNYYGRPDADHVLADLDSGGDEMTVAELADRWVQMDNGAGQCNLAGNDAHSQAGHHDVFENPALGNFQLRTGDCEMLWGAYPGRGFDPQQLASKAEVCLQGPNQAASANCTCLDLDKDGDIDLRDIGGVQTRCAELLFKESFPPHDVIPYTGNGWDVSNATHLLVEFSHAQPIPPGTFRITASTANRSRNYWVGGAGPFWTAAGEHAVLIDVDRFALDDQQVLSVTAGASTPVQITRVRWIVPRDVPRIAFSWDDGYATQWDAAMAMEAIGERAAIYIVGSVVDTPNYLTLDQILELDARGHFIGNHTLTHRELGVNITEEELYEEFVAMAEWMESVGLQRGARYAALPYGLATPALVERLVHDAGFKQVRQTRLNQGTWPTFRADTANPDYFQSIYNRPNFTNDFWPETVASNASYWPDVIDICIADGSTAMVYEHAFLGYVQVAIDHLAVRIQEGAIIHVLPDEL